ncbi:hypothetical protein MTO96_028769 [Rhipicephalus appendiculatus]
MARTDGEAVTSQQCFREATASRKFRKGKMATSSLSRATTAGADGTTLFFEILKPEIVVATRQRLGTFRNGGPQYCTCSARVFEGSRRRRTGTSCLCTIEFSFKLVRVMFGSSFGIRAQS